ncbi:MAG: DUF2905 domain-containing protein [Acidobacteria bacterium]|nr:DUF2905 domain-containing protein [Acidobacteriota bacterium]
MHPAKVLMLWGLILLLVGVFWYFAALGPLLRLGKLPGDISIQRGNWSIYIPITTCILVSILLTLVFFIFSLFRR